MKCSNEIIDSSCEKDRRKAKLDRDRSKKRYKSGDFDDFDDFDDFEDFGRRKNRKRRAR